MTEKQIVIAIKIDCERDQLKHVISFKGFNNKTPIQNTIEVIGFLEAIKQQEIIRLLKKETKRN